MNQSLETVYGGTLYIGLGHMLLISFAELVIKKFQNFIIRLNN